MVRPGSPRSLIPEAASPEPSVKDHEESSSSPSGITAGGGGFGSLVPPPAAVTNEELEYLHKRHMEVQATLNDAGVEYIDAFHGEMGFGVHDEVRKQLALAEENEYDVTDVLTGSLKSKTTPKNLQKLVSETIMIRWAEQIPGFSHKHILMTPYSSLLTLESALRSLQCFNPGKTSLLVPDGHYKSLVRHVKACNLKIIPIPTDIEDNCRLEPHALRAAIAQNREDLAGLLLTIPGNPLLSTYTDAELEALGRVLVEEDAYCVIDAAFELVVEPYKPLAAVVLEESGARLYDRVAMITGVSKSHHATGPEKFGAVVTGNAEWRKAMGMELSHQFQRETAARNELVLIHTPQDWLDENRALMRSGQDGATKCFQELEEKYGQKVFLEVGDNREGPFKVLTVASDLLERVGVFDSPRLQEYMLLSGMDSVPGIRVGLDATRGHVPAVRVNVHAPRIGNDISAKHRPKFYEALDACAKNFTSGPSYPELCARFNLKAMNVPVRGKPGRTSCSGRTVLGVINEGRSDNRVALTPASIKFLLNHDGRSDLSVLVESGAGLAAGFTDADFICGGATIVSREAVLSDSTMLVTYKPCKNMTENELLSLRDDQVVVGFYGRYGRGVLAREDMHFSGVSLDDGATPTPGVHSPLSAMSVYAGELALDHGADLLGVGFPERSKVESEEGEATSSTSAIVVGSGHAARAAAKRALLLKMTVTMISTSAVSDSDLASRIQQVRIPRGELSEARDIVSKTMTSMRGDVIVVTAASRSSCTPPVLITKEQLSAVGDDATCRCVAVVDLALAAGGNVEGAAIDSTIRVAKNVVVAHKSNYPSEMPRESSSAFASAVVRLLRGKDLL